MKYEDWDHVVASGPYYINSDAVAVVYYFFEPE